MGDYIPLSGLIGSGVPVIGGLTSSGSVAGDMQAATTIVEKDYENLKNLPQVNDETLIGNKSSEDLHIVSCKTSAEWAQLTTLVSREGEIYIYSDARSDAQGNPVPMAKVGDGNAYVVDLPFTSAVDLRITDADIQNWNNKVAVRIEGDRLIFY